MGENETKLDGLVDTEEALAPEQVNEGAAQDASSEDGGPQELGAETQIAALEAELADAKDQMLRALADAQNTRRRAEKEVADARAYANKKFAEDLLSVSDNLARALTALPDEDREGLSEAGRNLLGGIEMTEKELHAALARNGVTAIDAAPGATFDPNLHQAVSQIPSDQPSGTIAECFQTGWKMGERTLRAAMVAVSAGAAN
ncbi:MAG: nucleotide exchange factor GrpE [Pseudomonadota bacterium]